MIHRIQHKPGFLTCLLFATLISIGFSSTSAAPFICKPYKVLIIDGQNNHIQWPKITHMLKSYLEETAIFEVDVARTRYTWKGEDYLKDYAIAGLRFTEAFEQPKYDSTFQPDFSKYDAVICNFGWNAAPWSPATQQAFEEYISNGGGLVVIHAADNSFPQWTAYNEMIGLGGWGDRTEKDGPYVYYNDDGELIRDTSAGKAGAHGPQTEFLIQIRDQNHPITKGMPTKWMHTKDELYNRLRGPAENMTVLATAYSSPDQKGTGRHEPMMMVIDYGEGHIFHTPMGHADYSVACEGFLTAVIRGTEWVASGEVSYEIPASFPTEEQSNSRDYPRDHE